MTYLSRMEASAQEVVSGAYKPTRLEACEASLTLEQSPYVVRLAEFILFGEDKPSHFGLPKYVSLQPQGLIASPSVVARRKLDFRNNKVRPYIKAWGSTFESLGLPAPGGREVEPIREAIQNIQRVATGGTQSDGSRRLPQKILERLPQSDLPGAELRQRYNTWWRNAQDSLVREHLHRMSKAFPIEISSGMGARALSKPDLEEAIVNIAFPGPLQQLGGGSMPVALCVQYEQIWELRGYTRGELVSSLSLAPGERLTVEVHSWDKSSRKGEEELSTESEMRSSEKMTQRDALTVVQEYARQQNTKVEASGVVPIPKMPIKIGGSVEAKTSESVKNTTESVRERVLDASSTLKINRKVRIETSREVGREEKQTRTLENTNRCHSLNCHYFEVMANYLVTTRASRVQPCILIKNVPEPFTLDWILCHEGILIRSLLDQTFLSGFEGARVMKTVEVQRALEVQARLAAVELQSQQLLQQLLPHVDAILDAYHVITQDRDTGWAVREDCSGEGLMLVCIHRNLTPEEYEHIVVWFALSPETRTALRRLSDNRATGQDVATALMSWIAAGNPLRLNSRYDVEDTLKAFFDADDVDLPKALSEYDDAGLRASVDAAVNAVRAIPVAGAMPQLPGDQEEEASAQVELERLQCHLEENWLHYNQAVWNSEDHDQRFLRLQGYGPVAGLIDNELLGFYGDYSAYPLRDTSVISVVGLDKVQKQVEDDEVKGGQSPPVLISMPTPGLMLEAAVGECDACEPYIDESRTLDLRMNAAKAAQEEEETNRRQARIAANDLSDPEARPPALSIELLDGRSPGTSDGS